MRCCSSPSARSNARPPPANARAELEGLQLSELRRRAKSAGASEKLLDDAGDSDQPRERLIALVMEIRGEPQMAPAQAGEADPANELREELRRLRPSQLRKHALAAGVVEARLDSADDEEDPRAATIELIVASAPHPTSHADADPDSALRSELSGLKLSALRRRANEVTHDQDQLDEAADSSDPSAALINIIVSTEARQRREAVEPRTVDMPHMGRRASAQQGVPAPVAAPAQRSSKHVMLSYQWDHQDAVRRAFDILTRLGLRCWMDINGVGVLSEARAIPIRCITIS